MGFSTAGTGIHVSAAIGGVLKGLVALRKPKLIGWDIYVVQFSWSNVAGDMTGKYSYYTVYDGHEIIFHVSTMLPRTKETKQQVTIVILLHLTHEIP